MGRKVNFLGSFPKIVRNISDRKKYKKKNKKISLKFGKDYFDGDRKYGYGGYVYDGRWVAVAKKFIKKYNLTSGDKILDVGCAKGFLMHDIKTISKKKIQVYGVDISKYAKEKAMKTVKKNIFTCNCKRLPFEDNFFDLVISINTIHNLNKLDCKKSLKEINRVSKKNAFIQVDAYENTKERKIFLDWMLTAKTFMKPKEWINFFKSAGYKGDYFWTILKGKS